MDKLYVHMLAKRPSKMSVRAAAEYAVNRKVVQCQAVWRGYVARKLLAASGCGQLRALSQLRSLRTAAAEGPWKLPPTHAEHWPIAQRLVDRWVADGLRCVREAVQMISNCVYRAQWVGSISSAGTSVAVLRAGGDGADAAPPPLVLRVMNLRIHAMHITDAEAAQLAWVLLPMLGAKPRGFMGAPQRLQEQSGRCFLRRQVALTAGGHRVHVKQRRGPDAEPLAAVPTGESAAAHYSIATPRLGPIDEGLARPRLLAVPLEASAGEPDLAHS